MLIPINICFSREDIPEPIVLQQGDYGSRYVKAALYETPGVPCDLSEAVVTVIFRKNSVNTPEYDVVSVEDNVVTFLFPSGIAAEKGQGVFQLRVYANQSLIHSAVLPFSVRHSLEAAEGEIDPEPAFSALIDEAMRAIDAAYESAESVPYIGENDNWMTWDSEAKEYVDSGRSSKGLPGDPGEDGDDGVSPLVEIIDIPNGHRVIIVDADGRKQFDVLNGKDGSGAGGGGGYYVPTVDNSGNLSWEGTVVGMPTVPPVNIKGAPGEDGEDGEDGISPTVSVSKTGKTTTVTFVDRNGTKNATLLDGENGNDGVGISGMKQTTTSTEDGGENVFTVTTTNNQSSVLRVRNGNKGSTGRGIASIEQTVTSQESGGTNVITVTLDDETEKTFSVKNGTMVPYEMDLLWTNASPTSEMSSNTISLDLSGYAGVTIELYSASNSIPSHSLTSPMIRKNCGWAAVIFAGGVSYRRLFHVTESGVNVAAGTTGTTTADKTQNVPYKIYGVKGVTVN